jgi:hypothetical protein
MVSIVSVREDDWTNTSINRPVKDSVNIGGTADLRVAVSAVAGSSLAVLCASIRAADLSLIANLVWVTN